MVWCGITTWQNMGPVQFGDITCQEKWHSMPEQAPVQSGERVPQGGERRSSCLLTWERASRYPDTSPIRAPKILIRVPKARFSISDQSSILTSIPNPPADGSIQGVSGDFGWLVIIFELLRWLVRMNGAVTMAGPHMSGCADCS